MESMQMRLSLSTFLPRKGLALALFCSFQLAAQAQAPPPGFKPPPPHVNAPLGEIKRYPGDGEGAFKTGTYRDLFAEQGHTPAETRAKIDKAFQQLFHGDAQSERVYFEAGSNANGPLA
jgi:hypothetical protein